MPVASSTSRNERLRKSLAVFSPSPNDCFSFWPASSVFIVNVSPFRLKIPGIVLQIKHFLRSAKWTLDKVNSAYYGEMKLALLPVKRSKRKNKMKQIEVYVHTHEGVEPKLVKMSEESTVKQLLEAISAGGGLGSNPHEEFLVFLEDCDEPVEHHRKLSECEIRHRHHVHCHHCHRIKVSVFYNEEKHSSFPPSTKVERVLKWAIKEFRLTPADAADKILVLKGSAKDELPLDAHIGSFACPQKCAVNLCLTAPVEVQG
jgi:hypothetical protein